MIHLIVRICNYTIGARSIITLYIIRNITISEVASMQYICKQHKTHSWAICCTSARSLVDLLKCIDGCFNSMHMIKEQLHTLAKLSLSLENETTLTDSDKKC